VKKRITLIALLIAGFTFAQASKTVALEQNATAMKFAETITKEELKEDLIFWLQML